MNKKEIQIEIERRLSQGQSKSSVFQQLSGQGVKDRVLAYLIASYADPQKCDQHAKLIDAMIVISWLQLAWVVLIAIGLGLKAGLVVMLIATALLGGFAYLFVWGFTSTKAWAYNATIFMSIINLPQALKGFDKSPMASSVGFTLGIGLIAFTWYVRGKLFPDFQFIAPKKVKGVYVFSD